MPPRSETLSTSTFSGSPRAFSRGAAALRRSVGEEVAELLAELVAVDLACLHLVEEVEGGLLRRRPVHLGHVRRLRLLLVLEQQPQDRAVWIAPGSRCSVLVRRITAELVRGIIALVDRKPLIEPPCVQIGLTVDPTDIQAAAIARGRGRS